MAERDQRRPAGTVLPLALALADALPAPAGAGHARPARLLVAAWHAQLGTSAADAGCRCLLRRVHRRAGARALRSQAAATTGRAAPLAAATTAPAPLPELSAEHLRHQFGAELRHAQPGLRLAGTSSGRPRLQSDTAARGRPRGDGHGAARLRPGASAGAHQRCRGDPYSRAAGAQLERTAAVRAALCGNPASGRLDDGQSPAASTADGQRTAARASR